MAVLSFSFNEKTRKCFGTLLAALCVMQTLVGIGICSLGLYFHLDLEWKVYLIEGYNGKTLFLMILIVGGITAGLNAIGAKMCYDSGNVETRARFEKLLFVWLVLLFALIITDIWAGVMCFRHKLKIFGDFEIGLLSSINKYLTSEYVKVGLDKLQMEYSCCGADGFKDWMMGDWVPDEFNPLINQPGLKDTFREFYEGVPNPMRDTQLFVTPFSCCDLSHNGPCFHDYITQPSIMQGSNLAIRQTWWNGVGLYQRGCAEVIMDAYNVYLESVGYTILGALGFQILIAFLARYLQTSIDNIELFGNKETNAAPGWLCEGSICPCF